MSRKKNKSSFLGLLIILAIVGGSAFVYFSPTFERKAPTILLKNNGFWNLRKPLQLTISDDSGIKEYRVILKSKNDSVDLEHEEPLTADKLVNITLKPPRTAYTMKDKGIEIIVIARDISKWNFFKGNAIKKVFRLKIDKKRPNINIVNNSYKISHGGSALVIFKATDRNLDKLYILGKNGKKFIPEPFYKDGYYISLLAWPVQDDSFRATVVATDFAGNMTRSYVPLYLKNRKYRKSTLKLSNNFLNGKIANLAGSFKETQDVEDPVKRFKIINEDVRAKNEALIHKITSKVSSEKLNDFKINRMHPLKDAALVAYFGDDRTYAYKGKNLSKSYHLGIDLASTAMAKIRTENRGKVVFSDFNGIYGNMPIISYGLGLYTLYGHCSSIKVSVGDTVQRGEVIANTGKTGDAMGDHLHFGVLVQGIEVRPQEWMDSHWIKLNITNIIKEAKKIINRQ